MSVIYLTNYYRNRQITGIFYQMSVLELFVLCIIYYKQIPSERNVDIHKYK